MKRLHLILLVGFGLSLAGILVLFREHTPGWAFLRSYESLRIGMPRAEVQAMFGQEPEYRCRFGSSEIWYYASRGMLTPEFPADAPPNGTTYQSLDELPDVYDRVQIAFDEQGHVIAFTWIGETYTAEYLGGSVRGSHLKLVPPGVL